MIDVNAKEPVKDNNPIAHTADDQSEDIHQLNTEQEAGLPPVPDARHRELVVRIRRCDDDIDTRQPDWDTQKGPARPKACDNYGHQEEKGSLDQRSTHQSL